MRTVRSTIASLTSWAPWCWLLAEPLISLPHDFTSVSRLTLTSWLGTWQPRRRRQKLWGPLRARSVSQAPPLLVGQIMTQRPTGFNWRRNESASRWEEWKSNTAKGMCRGKDWSSLKTLYQVWDARWENLVGGMERKCVCVCGGGVVTPKMWHNITFKMWCFNWPQHSRFIPMNSEYSRTHAFIIWMTSIKVG